MIWPMIGYQWITGVPLTKNMLQWNAICLYDIDLGQSLQITVLERYENSLWNLANWENQQINRCFNANKQIKFKFSKFSYDS